MASKLIRVFLHDIRRVVVRSVVATVEEGDVLSRKFIDTEQFQRQVCLSHMAYPGAVHSRFEHSFGVYWLAGNVVEKLKAHQQVIQGSKWIPLSPSDDDMFPFKLRRKQFPVRLCFAMTINKAQGQTIPNVGVYLPEPVFSHGQLYVALSRGISRGNTKVLVKSVEKSNVDEGYTSNVVYKEVLSD
ncbi:hypothetical protein LXL04_011771 [Taraxacum kok-saghyz]